jgi:D-glycero-beta-D-manno-heptose 1-phosphate adenylyltransferase
VKFRDKIIAWDHLPAWRLALRNSGRRLAVTNGCFDLLHVGHVTYLESARNLGDALLVGLNSDDSVRQLKGPSRPVSRDCDRAAVLAALECVSAVCVFFEKSAALFLARARPDIYVKGGDYNLETMDQDERQTLEHAGAQIVFIPFVPGQSTTETLARITRLPP